MEKDTDITPFTLEAVAVETVIVLPTREEPITALLFIVEPTRLDTVSVLPKMVEYVINPPKRLDVVTVEPINVFPETVETCIALEYTV